MRHIDKTVWHSTATKEGQDISMETVRTWHLDRGWSDIGYHYVIELDGSVKAGRPLIRSGAHGRGNNEFANKACPCFDARADWVALTLTQPIEREFIEEEHDVLV